jgi:hypothetical protein
MSKTKHRSNKKHTKRRHTKRRYTKRRHTKRRHLYRKRREIKSVPGARGVPIFSPPEKKNNTPILDNTNLKDDVEMIPGLKNYLKNKK